MNNIDIISASAGSGKTYALAQQLLEHIQAKKARPSAVLATTFTNKAADELRSRIRRRLIRDGLLQEAQELEGARIGTVNSVCGQLVTEFAFELGLPPELSVLDEEGEKLALGRAVALAANVNEIKALQELAQRLGSGDWHEVVAQVVRLARSNNIDPENLSMSADKSVESFLTLLPGCSGTAQDWDTKLANALEKFIKNIPSEDTTKATSAAVAEANRWLGQLQAGHPLPWQAWLKASKIDPGKKSEALAQEVHGVAGGHLAHPRLQEDISSFVQQVFSVAERVLASYQRQKAESGFLDFIDQEALALKLLKQPEVRECLAGQLDLVLVDEFQDTSPIQLALFLEFARIAKKSTWVGDQKQAIFGFRDTDPALMDAALEAIEKEGGKDRVGILQESWRSRPELVDLTSSLFVPPFKALGIPEERVRLKAAEEKQPGPKGLGPIVERWVLESKNAGDDAGALAAATKEFLEDSSSMVRNPGDEQPRGARPGDVAILCRENKTCGSVAEALQSQGIPVKLAHAGLLCTPEARLVMAGLRLWVDPGDALAIAELARITEYPTDGNAWMEKILAAKYAKAFEAHPLVTGIRERGKGAPLLGVLPVIDRVCEAVDVREWCLRWGNSGRRFANLEALRAHAVHFTETATTQAAGCTPAGFLAYMVGLAKSEMDTQALGGSDNAVTVTTWHKSKGLEWPVTVLFGFDKEKKASALGVNAQGQGAEIDLEDPLADRWIRFWPSPYTSQTSKSEFHDALASHAFSKAIAGRKTYEDLRLLYVAWTRARDRVVLAARKGKIAQGLAALLVDEAKKPVLVEPGDGKAAWGGFPVAIKVRNAAPREPVTLEPVYTAWYAKPLDMPELEPAYVQPSALEGKGNVGEPIEIGVRIALKEKPDMAEVGNAVHGFLAADPLEADREDRVDLAQDILERWGLSDVLGKEEMVKASDTLCALVKDQWPDAAWRREWPIQHRLETGSILRGNVDLVLELESSFVLIDHKTFPGNRKQAMERAAQHAGQLLAYSEAIAAATGKTCAGMFLYLPIVGTVIPVA